MNKKHFLHIAIGMLLLSLMVTGVIPVSAETSSPGDAAQILAAGVTIDSTGQNVCPDGGPWDKTDGINSQSYVYPVPVGKVVLETCYKAGTSLRWGGPFDPGLASYTFESTVWNSQHNAYKDISHVSVRLGDAPTPVPKPKLGVGACMVSVEGPWKMHGNAHGPEVHWRLYNYGTGAVIDLGMLGEGDSFEDVTAGSGTWKKQYWDGDSWVSVGGTHTNAYDQWPEQRCEEPEPNGSIWRQVSSGSCVVGGREWSLDFKAENLQNIGEGSVYMLVIIDGVSQQYDGPGPHTDTWTLDGGEHTGDIELWYSPSGDEPDVLLDAMRGRFNVEDCPVIKTYKSHQAYLENSCEGIKRVVNLYENGVVVDTLVNETIYFTDPAHYETIPALPVDIPEEYGEDYTFPAMSEPETCHDFYTKDHQAATCDGWQRVVNLYDDGTLLDTLLNQSGSWTDPYELETLAGTTFQVSDEYGPDVVFEDLDEPADCKIFKTYKAHQTYLDDSCEGIRRVVHLYEGPASDPYRDLVDWDFYDVTTYFDDPLVLETIDEYKVDVPEDYGDDYTFAAMTEPEVCHNFWVDYDQNADCETYDRHIYLYDGDVKVDVVVDISAEWMDPFVNEMGLPEATYEIPADFGYGGSISFNALNEPTSCQVPHETTFWGWSNCTIWETGYTLDGEKVTTDTGEWGDPYGPESITREVVIPIPEGEKGDRVGEVTVDKSESCISCKTVVAYYQAFVRPSNEAPETYMQQPFGETFCPVITTGPEDAPADFRITDVCSLCEDQIEGGYIFEGTASAKDVAPVYRVTCWNGSGYDTHYTWMGKVWKYGSTYDPMYTPEGRLVEKYPRCEGCSDWIHANAPEGIYPESE